MPPMQKKVRLPPKGEKIMLGYIIGKIAGTIFLLAVLPYLAYWIFKRRGNPEKGKIVALIVFIFFLLGTLGQFLP